ncbi:putative atrial natriuretic peptide receptor 1-like isoform X1 [Apostichopus japonicus]|uniref:Guanylate cyclase n=1 Tax=Stichopus japonicus TaxID=307972 RepID=A0A2G8LRH9_STIJA|nr:putative atrial natriuretic peptide receptor 1-like isoform X1 [Apostichopus japonicus]
MYLSYLLWSITLVAVATEPNNEVSILSVYGEDTGTDEIHLRPAVQIAVETVRSRVRQGEYHEFQFNVIHKSIDCQGYPIEGPALAALYYLQYNVTAFVGPPCTVDIISVADLAASWNIPAISGVASAVELSDKTRFTTFTRTSFLADGLASAVVATMSRYNWKRCSFISSNTGYWSIMEEALANVLQQNNIFVHFVGLEYFQSTKAAMQEAGKLGRIIVMATDGPVIRNLMLDALDLGYINGEFVFFNIYPFTDDVQFKDFSWQSNDDRDSDAKLAYEALLTISVTVPTAEDVKNFRSEIRTIQAATLNYTSDMEESLFLAGTLHDAIILYSLAINETIGANADIRDGTAISIRMRDRKFQGVFGEVKIKPNGDRDSDYLISDMTDTITGTFEVVAYFLAESAGVFQAVNGKEIKWPAGAIGPPLDEPICGFYNEKSNCNRPEGIGTLAVVLVTSIVFVSIIILAFAWIYRRFRRENEVMKMLWKLNYGDLLFVSTKSSEMSTSSKMLTAPTDSESIMEKKISVNVAHFMGRLVVVKKVKKNVLTVTRAMLEDLTAMKDFDHTNVNRFVGACTEAANICFVMFYCSKGSLKDILENESLHIDWAFKYSLMTDVFWGLNYLHCSVIGMHGRLTSSNCVIDSRFVLKLTDFGLFEFRQGEEIDETSPEQILSTTKAGECSAGIVMHEIILRSGPFGMDSEANSVDEILQRVKNCEHPPYRPHLNEELSTPDVMELCQNCWSEKPEDRPSASALVAFMKSINKKANYTTNVLFRMEQYANNLEALVQERTEAFLEEKKRCERLLYEVLPRPVAEQLKKGLSVDPETYECVTVYFSDIVEFTKLSAQSTPMQVVTFLNDLYLCFDNIIGNYEVYKVETIGDAYMVVSGLPVRNGNVHSREIASMAVALLRKVENFTVRHMPEYQLQLRAGIHCGSVVAGVVGSKMPRYCLFGDTVNTASSMEATSEAMKIQVSSEAKFILDSFFIFKFEERGEIELRGKGKQKTFWLLGLIAEKQEKQQKKHFEEVYLPPNTYF